MPDTRHPEQRHCAAARVLLVEGEPVARDAIAAAPDGAGLDGQVLRARDRFLPKPVAPVALVRVVQGLAGSPCRRAPRGGLAAATGEAHGAPRPGATYRKEGFDG